MDQAQLLRLLVIALVFTVGLLLWLAVRLRRWGEQQGEQAVADQQAEDRAARRERAQIAAQGEMESIALLTAAGYEVVASQERATAILMVDGEERHFEVKPDHVVEKDGAVYVADVKTGREASLRNAKTRRQLLEYKLVFQADGALLVDMVQRRIQQIEFINYEPQVEDAQAQSFEPAPSPGKIQDWKRLGTAVGAGLIVGASGATWLLLR